MKLRTNLASRPFYNVRAVRALIGALGLIVVALSLFNVVQLVRLSASQRTLGARASEAETRAQRLRTEAARIRTQINQRELETVSAAAREANSIIDRRAFSWTGLFIQLEATLPDDVRSTAPRQRHLQGRHHRRGSSSRGCRRVHRGARADRIVQERCTAAAADGRTGDDRGRHRRRLPGACGSGWRQ
jgi:hypothetical protein